MTTEADKKAILPFLLTSAPAIVIAVATGLLTFSVMRSTVEGNSSHIADIEHRVRDLESGRVIAERVESQGKKLDQLVEIVSKDHDSIVTLSAVVRQNAERP